MDFDRFSLFFIAAWAIAALASVGLAGVIIWAIVRAVTKYL